jgi:hypothetical protein
MACDSYNLVGLRIYLIGFHEARKILDRMRMLQQGCVLDTCAVGDPVVCDGESALTCGDVPWTS